MTRSGSVGNENREGPSQDPGVSPSWLEIKDRQDRLVARVALQAEPMIVGRAATAAIRLDHETISRQHAEFFRDPFDRWWVRDLGSRNGIKINHRKVTEGVIATGDVIRLGDFHFELHHAPETGPAQVSVEACPPLTDAADVELSTVDEVGSPQIDAQHLTTVMELGERLRRIADPPRTKAGDVHCHAG
jgi:pSer/pThr/pTyr-binding forkhead associated (FHA) protein